MNRKNFMRVAMLGLVGYYFVNRDKWNPERDGKKDVIAGIGAVYALLPN